MRVFLDELLECFPLDVFHNDIREFSRNRGVVHLDDIGMAQHRQVLCFGLELSEDFLVFKETRVHNLNRGIAFKFRVKGFVYFGHPT